MGMRHTRAEHTIHKPLNTWNTIHNSKLARTCSMGLRITLASTLRRPAAVGGGKEEVAACPSYQLAAKQAASRNLLLLLLNTL